MSDKLFLSHNTTLEDILDWTKAEIKTLLKKNNLKISGNKTALAKRLCDHNRSTHCTINSDHPSAGSGNNNNNNNNNLNNTRSDNNGNTLNNEDNRIDVANLPVSKIPDIDDLHFGWSSDKRLLPRLTHNDVEKYLIHSSHRTEDKAKMRCYRQFIRGYNFHREGYIHKLMVNEIDKDSKYCYIRSKCYPSMKKDEVYEQWILMTKTSPCNILKAYCSCPAGLGEGCTHVAGQLFNIEASNQDENLPSTSKPCEWNKPSKRKSVNEKVSDINFKRFRYDDHTSPTPKKKHKSYAINKENFLSNLCNQLGDCNAVLFHISDQTFNSEIDQKPEDDINVVNMEEVTTSFSSQSLADKYIDLKSLIRNGDLSQSEFLNLMNNITSSEIEEIELKTRGQSENPLWRKTRVCRLTASSNFHDIKIRKPSTPDTKLVDGIISSDISSLNVPSLQWGKKHEPIAKKRYVAYLKLKYNQKVEVLDRGIYICEGKGYLGASPDGIVLAKGEKWLLEIKCPMKWRNKTVLEACESKDFYCYVENGDIKLKDTHKYYTQIQGLMAICNLQKCDFCVYTLKDIKIIEVHFDSKFWLTLLPLLEIFYKKSVLPRLFC